MPEAPFYHLLDAGAEQESSDDALAAVVRRHRRRRALRVRAAAVCAVVVLGGAALGLGLSQSTPPTVAALHAGAAARVERSEHPGLRLVRVQSSWVAASPLSASSEATATRVDVLHRSTFSVSLAKVPSAFGAASEAPTSSTDRSTVTPRCSSTGEVLLQVSRLGRSVGSLDAPVTSGVKEPVKSLAEASFRLSRHERLLVAAAGVERAVVGATGRFAGGVARSTTPVDGWVVFFEVVRGSDATSTPTGIRIAALGRKGRVLEHVAIPGPGYAGVAARACPVSTK